jgi:spore photoproduct lyase
MNSKKLTQISSFPLLPDRQRTWLKKMADTYPLSFQQLKILTECGVDMICWDAGSLDQFYQPEKFGDAAGKKAATLFFQQIKKGYDRLARHPKKYLAAEKGEAEEMQFPPRKIIETELIGSIMGTCPVASGKTRCCNLMTLDAVQQCGFRCSYCSIQSFYHGDQVRFIKNLAQHLGNLKLDPQKTYHIGTGQSSDSLMWGNHLGLLDALCDFAKDNPNAILEMKSKSGRIDHLLELKPPANMIFTWSLNTPTVIFHEEKGSASLQKRLDAARKLADIGSPVGFHLHPIIWYEGWREQYTELIAQLTDMFSPEEVVMVSLGTLTFIKSVIKRVRNNLLKSSILQMPMEEIGGKASYPFDIKKELFTYIYNSFPENWKSGVFFYMCMEDVRLWQPVFNNNYACNEEFETAMVTNYCAKIRRIQARFC